MEMRGGDDRKVAGFIKKKLYLNSHINITDNTRLEIENCKKIMECNDVYIKLKTSSLMLTVYGKDLRISDYNRDGLIIKGVISSIEFWNEKNSRNETL